MKHRICRNCPFRKDSPPGYTTFNKNRIGTYEGFEAVRAHAIFNTNYICHETIKRFKKEHACVGRKQFEKGGYKNIFKNVEDMEKHHVYRKL